MWWIVALIAVAAAGLLFCILPARAADAQRAPLAGRTYAHRGLYAADQSVPENSLPAFRAAVAAGYGVELDVQLTRDGRVVVFHDDTLLRACGVDARVDAFSFDELTAQMRLFGTQERIPLFSEVLEVLGGRVPVIVELKTGGDKYGLCQRTLSLLEGTAARTVWRASTRTLCAGSPAMRRISCGGSYPSRCAFPARRSGCFARCC